MTEAAKQPKWVTALANADFVVAGICLSVLIILTFIGVPMRYLFNAPIIWQQEVQMWMFLWTIFFAAGGAFRTGSHVSIEIVVELFPVKAQRIIKILVAVVTVAVLGYVLVQSIAMVSQHAATERSSNVLSVPFTVIYSAVPIGIVLMIGNFVYLTIQQLREKPTAESAAEVAENAL
ncbi:MAG: TRAP transporter small permease [Propionibacteriaceae bacterium]|jgi:TRAP-type C4-dicarboxylate transport system permease small subunit|nr:TRAP transporter small permease [Propionibacteriaceae bacterium]